MATWTGRCWRAGLILAIFGLAWLVAQRSAPAERATAAAVSERGVVFGGLSSQRRPIVVQVTPLRTRVVRVDWSWQAKCILGPAAPAGTSLVKSWTDTTNPLRFDLTAAGRWTSGRYTTGPFTDSATGITDAFTYKLTGRIVDGGRRMTGTIRASYEQASPAGVIRTCVSGLITFTIRD